MYAGQAGMLAGDQELSRYFLPISRGNTNFLLYQYIVALAYRLAGVGEVPARVVSVIFSTLTVPVLLELGRTLYSKRVGYIAAVALAAPLLPPPPPPLVPPPPPAPPMAAPPFPEIGLTLFCHGVESAGWVPAEQWRRLLDHHAGRQRFLGVDPDVYPLDFASFVRLRPALEALPRRAPMPPPLARVAHRASRSCSTRGPRLAIPSPCRGAGAVAPRRCGGPGIGRAWTHTTTGDMAASTCR